MDRPHIAIIYDESLPESMFRDFVDDLETDQLRILLESRPPHGAQACLEWFIFPVVAVWIAKPYFDAFFGEMGKDHYSRLAKRLGETTTKVISKARIEPVLVGTPGKLKKQNPYTLAFSIYAEVDSALRFKLLLPKHDESNDYGEIVEVFLEFLAEFHSGSKSLEDIGYDTNTKPMNGLIFVHVNPLTRKVEWLDPMSKL